MGVVDDMLEECRAADRVRRAAPDLLEACQAFLDADEGDSVECVTLALEQAQLAVDKATILPGKE